MSEKNIENTKDLIGSMQDISLSDDESLVSFDAKSLFMSVPDI